MRKIIFFAGLTEAVKVRQKSLLQYCTRAQRANQGRTPFVCTPRDPICLLSFTVSTGHPSLVSAYLFEILQSLRTGSHAAQAKVLQDCALSVIYWSELRYVDTRLKNTTSSYRRSVLFYLVMVTWPHCKDTLPKIETNIPRIGIARPQFQFSHSCICELIIYSHDRSAYSATGKYVDWSWEYIKLLLDTWMWKLGRRSRNSFSGGTHKWDFRCCATWPWHDQNLKNLPAQVFHMDAINVQNYGSRFLVECRGWLQYDNDAGLYPWTTYTVKKVINFPVHRQGVTDQTYTRRE